MNSYLYDEIIPGERVGKFILGDNLKKLRDNIDFEYVIRDTPYGIMLDDINKNIRFFLTNKDCLQQITVYSNYKGKILGKIGIGDKLSNSGGFFEYYTNELDSEGNYYLSGYPGVSIILENWSMGDSSSIQIITVYNDKLGLVDEYV